MKIEIERGGDYLARYAARLRAIGEYEAQKALANALNRAGTSAFGKVRTALSSHLGIKYSSLGLTRALRKKGAWMDDLEFKIIATGRHFGMIHAKGVRTVKSTRMVAGRPKVFRQLYASAWNVPRAYPGAFIGKAAGGPQIFVRNGADRLPVRVVWGPSVPTELLREPAVTVWEEAIEDTLPKRLEHEVSRLFDKL
ncbi:phage tail protein [Xanthobacter sp. VTT E-85241]|uniref:phage tail protein n=1 Tax=Roseixanthobacter finlandensis TaxID=3119922 RepID=UPI0037280D0B